MDKAKDTGIPNQEDTSDSKIASLRLQIVKSIKANEEMILRLQLVTRERDLYYLTWRLVKLLATEQSYWNSLEHPKRSGKF